MRAVRRTLKRTLKGTGAAAGLLLLLGAGFAPAVQARTSCVYAGAPSNRLTVTVDQSVIKRKGLEITAGDFLEQPKPCAGGTPTVLNTDAIVVQAGGQGATADLRLDGGPFAPGATPEADGASEMEIQFDGSVEVADILGTPGGDEFHWGPGGAAPGLNLNPRSAGDQDVDVTTRGTRTVTLLVAEGAGGNDTIIGAPGAVVPGSAGALGGPGDDVLQVPRGNEGSFLEGGSGNDLIVGAGGKDSLEGAAGNDVIVGGGGPDDIGGGRGKDRLFGGAGRDTINSVDSKRDTVSCGPGRDRVRADRLDRVRGCERVSRR